MPHSDITPRIAIAGGGPGALTLGVLLYQRNIPFTILELRARPTEAQLDEPSGSLDLHEESGLAAIRACGLFDKFVSFTSDCDESMIIADKTGTVLHADQGGESYRPEIARNNLARLLLDALPDDCVRWGSKVLQASSEGSTGEVQLRVRNTATGKEAVEAYDLVVGADGAWSRVRPLLSQAEVELSGIHWFRIVIPSFPARFPALAEYVGKGMFMCLGNRHMVCGMPAVRGSENVTLMINGAGAGEGVAAGLGDVSVAEARARLLGDEALFGGFGGRAEELVRVALDERVAAGGRLEVKPLAVLPAGHRWEPRANATLIGDAAHLMLPSGEGVNLAMWDALDVAGAIAAAWERCGGERGQFQGVLGPLMREAEEGMYARAHKEAVDSVSMNATMFGEDGAKGLADFMTEAFRLHAEMAAAQQ